MVEDFKSNKRCKKCGGYTIKRGETVCSWCKSPEMPEKKHKIMLLDEFDRLMNEHCKKIVISFCEGDWGLEDLKSYIHRYFVLRSNDIHA